MKNKLAFLSYLVLSVYLTGTAALADEAKDWQGHYSRAERAYASNNLFEARREFLTALKEARSCKQDFELARRVETLADTYQSQEKDALAQPLFKLARKLKSKSSST